MLAACGMGVLIAWHLPSLTQSIILIGLVSLTAGMVVAIGTRWGQSHPLAKCVALSVVAHLLLVIYALTTHFIFHNSAATQGYQKFARVHLENDATLHEATELPTDPDPSQQEVPDALANLPSLTEESPAPPEEEPSTAPDLLPSPMPEEVPPEIAADPQPTEPPAQSDPQPVPLEAVAQTSPPPMNPTEATTASADSNPEPSEPITMPVATTVRPTRLADGAPVPATYATRLTDREALLAKYGGDANTEQAVQAALQWLAKNQSADGRWDPAQFGAGRETKTLGHDRGGCGAKAATGITSLALLAFLGSGETHLAGAHRENVQHALEFLLASQAADGNLAGQAEFFAAMYCHSISLLALGEAHAMTGDRRLQPALKRALEFSIHAQHSSGSWRYRAQEPGDMSQFGWHVMAFRSAQIGEIEIPAETIARMKTFLERCSLGSARGLGSYRPGDGPSRTMTAEALVCRYFLESSNSPAALTQAANYVLEEPPTGRLNLYYWYYGTVAMFQRGGSDWQRWNDALKPALLNTQRGDGIYAGSWDPDIYWGGYGGRVYSTSLGALCLETYYRHLPVNLSDEERELRWTELPKETPK